MSNKRRQFRAIRDALGKMYSEEPKGNLARHLNTLAALVSGIVGSKHTNFPAIAKEVPDGTKRESRVKRFHRWVKNDRIDSESPGSNECRSAVIIYRFRCLRKPGDAGI